MGGVGSEKSILNVVKVHAHAKNYVARQHKHGRTMKELRSDFFDGLYGTENTIDNRTHQGLTEKALAGWQKFCLNAMIEVSFGGRGKIEENYFKFFCRI